MSDIPPKLINLGNMSDKQLMIENIIRQSKKNPDMKIYDNQIQTADFIAKSIKDCPMRSMFQIIAPMQSGKTGVIISTSIELCDIGYDFDKQIIITGLSDNSWVEQTMNRMTGIMKDEIKVLHRPQLLKHNHLFENLENGVIIIDESHTASEEAMILAKEFDKFGFNDHEVLQKKNIKIIAVSATPDGVYEGMKNNPPETYMIINFKPDHGYTGLKELLERGQIKDGRKLIQFDKDGSIVTQQNKESLTKVRREMREKYKNKGNRYHIFRLPHGITESDATELFEQTWGVGEFRILWWCDSFKNKTINFDILEKEPECHTFIFVKERLRMAKTIHKSFLGILYDRIPKSQKDNGALSQSLAGRCCGYYKNDDIIIYTDIQSIKNYVGMIENEWSSNANNYRSKTVTYSNGHVKSINTYIGTGKDDITMGQTETEQEEFDTFEEMKKFICDKLLKSGPRKSTLEKNKTVDGFYVHHEDTIKKVRKYDDVKNNKRGLSSKATKGTSTYRWIPCYKDITDKNTLVFVVIYTP